MIERRLKPTGRKETGMPSQSSLKGFSEHVQYTTSPIDATKRSSNNNSDSPWSLVSGFSKETAETWSVLGNMSSSSNLSTIVGNPLAKMAQPKYLVASQEQEHMPTSEGIICKALNVVSDESSRSSAEQSLKKVAKKRRKENDEDGLSSSILHYTKSSKDYLRKAQQSLKDSFHSRAASPDEKPQQSQHLSKQATLQSIHHPDNQRRRLLTSTVVQSQRSQASMMVQQQEPEEQDEATVATVSTTTYESVSSSNPYGYEDPDQSATLAPIQVTRVGVARRRGSVTKFSLQDTAAAAVATDRIMKLQLHQQGTRAYTFSSGDSAAAATLRLQQSNASSPTTNTTPRRQRSLLRQRDGSPDFSRAASVPRSMGEKEATLRTDSSRDSSVKPRRLRSLRMMMGDGGQTNEVSSLAGGLDRLSAPLRQRSSNSPSNFNENLSTFPDIAPKQVQEEPSRSRGSMAETTASNPYGYEDPDASSWKADAPQDAQTNQPQTAGTSNEYGYEDPDSFAQHRRTTDQNSNPYGYGDEPEVQQPRPQRRHPRPQRRGSVTKFSIQAQFKEIDSQVVITQDNNNNKTIVPMAVDDTAPSRGAPTRSMAAPERQPTTAAWQHREILKAPKMPPSPFASRKTALANRSSSFQASQVQRSESLRSRGSINEHLNDDSDSNDSDDSSIASFEDGDFCDLTIPIDGMPKSPMRSESFRSRSADSFRSRSDSFRSFDSDASGLEADMQSLCSISRHDHEPMSPPPPPPSYLSRTPTPNSGSRTTPKMVARQASFGQELREKLKNERSASFSALEGGTTPFITFETGAMSPRLLSPRRYGCVRTPSNSKKMLSPKLGTPATCASTTVSSTHTHASALSMPPPNLSPSMTAGRQSIRKHQGELSNL